PVDGHGGSGHDPPILDFATPQQTQKLAELNAELKKVADEVVEMEKTVFPPPAPAPATQVTTVATTVAATTVATTQTAKPQAASKPSTQATSLASTPPAKPEAEGKAFTAADSPAAAGLSGNIIEALRQRPENRAGQFLLEIINHYKDSNPRYADAIARVKKAIDQRDEFNTTTPRVMVMQELPKTRDAFVLTKGSYDKPADKVTARTPSTLPAVAEGEKKDRLALAKWLFSSEHPLTSRVIVNRYWQQFFGAGIVKTAEDFGVQGERPSHPELLDWLAVEFRESGWDVKHVYRLIVTSAAYRQSSKVTADLLERDPENRLLA